MAQPKSVRTDTAASTSLSGTYVRRIGPFSGTMMVVGGIMPRWRSPSPAIVVGSIASNPGNAVEGTTLILLGVPVFLFWKGKR